MHNLEEQSRTHHPSILDTGPAVPIIYSLCSTKQLSPQHPFTVGFVLHAREAYSQLCGDVKAVTGRRSKRQKILARLVLAH
jgi:hypothetical protein